MQYVELQLPCGSCPLGDQPILGAFWIHSFFDEFVVAEVNERPNQGMTRQMPDGPDGRQRFKFPCPRPQCANAPVLKQETVDDWLAAVYAQYGKGAIAAIARRPI